MRFKNKTLKTCLIFSCLLCYSSILGSPRINGATFFMEPVKVCNTCCLAKPESLFHFRNGKPRSNCKECHKLICKEYHYTNRAIKSKPVNFIEGEVWAQTLESSQYQVSNLGRVKSLLGNKEWLLTPHVVGRYGHVEILGKQKKVHRLVGVVFIPNPQNLPQINHKDGDKMNNAAINLEWCTPSQNQLHAYRTGLSKRNFGINNKTSKQIDQFTLSGAFVRTWGSASEAIIDGFHDSGIIKCCKGKWQYYKKFMWRYSKHQLNER